MLAISSQLINANVTAVTTTGIKQIAIFPIKCFTFFIRISFSHSLLYSFSINIVIIYSITTATAIANIPAKLISTLPYLTASNNTAVNPILAIAPINPFFLNFITMQIAIINATIHSPIITIFNVSAVMSEYTNRFVSIVYFNGIGSVFNNTAILDADWIFDCISDVFVLVPIDNWIIPVEISSWKYVDIIVLPSSVIFIFFVVVFPSVSVELTYVFDISLNFSTASWLNSIVKYTVVPEVLVEYCTFASFKSAFVNNTSDVSLSTILNSPFVIVYWAI